MIVFYILIILFVSILLYLWKAHSRFRDYEVGHFTPIPVLGNASHLLLKTHQIGIDIQMLCQKYPDDRSYSRFHDYGVSHEIPFPLLGNESNLISRARQVAVDHQILCQRYPNDKFVGRYELTKPLIVLKDPELIKKVTVKDFEYFLDHRHIVDEEVDSLFGRALFCLKGQEWKDMRSTLSPAFTSSKIKNMVPFMVEVNKQMIDNIKEKIDESKVGYVDLDIKDLTTRYTNDVIASCAFGVKVNSHKDLDNEFYLHGRSSGNFGLRKIIVFLGYNSFPSIMKSLNLKLFEEEIRQFFKSLVLTTMDNRETKSIFRPDMIQLLMEAKKGKLVYDEAKGKESEVGFATAEESDVGKRTVAREWTDDDLIAQAFVFFLAGFETVSTTMTMLFHELAAHPDIQEKLYQEIMETEQKYEGKLDYNVIQSMKYLDMCVSEALRLWPAVVGLDRTCIRDYNMGKPNDKAKKDYIIRRGENLTIPTYTIHRDERYYPNPDQFDPERFSDENKDQIKPFTYMPFGIGPRNCIGSRFALTEVKVMTYQFLQQFEISQCEKTVRPIVMAPQYFTIVIQGGHTLRLSYRKQKTN